MTHSNSLFFCSVFFGKICTEQCPPPKHRLDTQSKLVCLKLRFEMFFRHASVSSTYPAKTGITVVLRRITVVLLSITVVLRHDFGFPFCQGLWSPYVKS